MGPSPQAITTSILATVLCACMAGDAQAAECGDLDGNGVVVSTDALLLLKRAVGQNVDLACSTCSTTTTSTTSSTTTTTMLAQDCDVLEQDCLHGTDGCYISLTTFGTVCAPAQGIPLGQSCTFLNDCTKGAGCVLVDDPVNPEGFICAFFCNASDDSPGCLDTGGPGPPFVCVRLNDFYSDVNGAPVDLGICVDPNVYPVP